MQEPRNHTRGRWVTIVVAVVALVTLMLAGIRCKEWLIERWYIRRLGVGTREEMLVAAKYLGHRKCVDAVPAILRAMSRTSEAEKRHPLTLLVGPAEILPGTSPLELPRGWEELGFLKAIHDMMPSARAALIRCLGGSDPTIVPWAATVLAYSVGSSSFGDWVHQGRWVLDVQTLVPALKDLQGEDQPLEVRRAASEALKQLQGGPSGINVQRNS